MESLANENVQHARFKNDRSGKKHPPPFEKTRWEKIDLGLISKTSIMPITTATTLTTRNFKWYCFGQSSKSSTALALAAIFWGKSNLTAQTMNTYSAPQTHQRRYQTNKKRVSLTASPDLIRVSTQSPCRTMTESPKQIRTAYIYLRCTYAHHLYPHVQ